MSLYAKLFKPMGDVHGFVIPQEVIDKAVKERWEACKASLRCDLSLYGVTVTKDGKRIDPKDIYLTPADDELNNTSPKGQ